MIVRRVKERRKRTCFSLTQNHTCSAVGNAPSFLTEIRLKSPTLYTCTHTHCRPIFYVHPFLFLCCWWENMFWLTWLSNSETAEAYSHNVEPYLPWCSLFSPPWRPCPSPNPWSVAGTKNWKWLTPTLPSSYPVYFAYVGNFNTHRFL